MMYPYMTLSDETEIVHSQLIEDKGIKKVIVNLNDQQIMDLIQQDVNFLNTNGQKKKDIVMKKSHSLKNCSIAMLIYYTNTLQMEE